MRWRLSLPDSPDKVFEVSLVDIQGETFTFLVDGCEVKLNRPRLYPFSLRTDELQISFEAWNAQKWRGVIGSKTHTLHPISWGSAGGRSETEIRSQMPGRILKIFVK